MKICQLLGSIGYAGLEKHVVELCNGLADLGHEVVLVAADEYRQYLSDQVSLEPFDVAGWRYNPIRLFRLLGIIRRQNPDIVHAQANKAAAMFAVIARFAPGLHIATLHSLKKNTKMYMAYDHVIAVSNQAAASVGHERVSVIYNGIQPVSPSRTSGREYFSFVPGIKNSRPVVLAVGRLVDVKGFDILVRAWSYLDADLVIAGEGGARTSLEALINELGLGDRVHLIGQRDDIVELASNADLLVISSRREGFPYILIEALQSRALVVSTKVPGSMDLLPQSVLVECNNPDALHVCIETVLKNPDSYRVEFEAAWDYAQRELTLNAMVSRTESVYRGLLAGSAGGF